MPSTVRPPYMRSRGHGFAVGSIAPGGEIDDKMKVNLEKYQVIAVHPNQYIPETGYLACGETDSRDGYRRRAAERDGDKTLRIGVAFGRSGCVSSFEIRISDFRICEG